MILTVNWRHEIRAVLNNNKKINGTCGKNEYFFKLLFSELVLPKSKAFVHFDEFYYFCIDIFKT